MPNNSKNVALILGMLIFIGVIAYFSFGDTQSEPLITTTSTAKDDPLVQVQLVPPHLLSAVGLADSSDAETSAIVASSPWLSAPLNNLSNTLYQFIETEQISYINTRDYPFDEDKQQQLRMLAKSGAVLMFDNSDSEYLDGYGVSVMDVVSEYFGTASEGDVIIATGVETEDGGMHYLVLPLINKDVGNEDALIEDVRLAVKLLKQQESSLVK